MAITELLFRHKLFDSHNDNNYRLQLRN